MSHREPLRQHSQAERLHGFDGGVCSYVASLFADIGDPANYDATAGAACLQEIQNAALTCRTTYTSGVPIPSDTPSPCDAVYNIVPGAAPGSACTTKWDCAPPSTGVVACSGGKCVNYVPGKAGDACSKFGPTGPISPVCRPADGLPCDTTTSKCKPLLGTDGDHLTIRDRC